MVACVVAVWEANSPRGVGGGCRVVFVSGHAELRPILRHVIVWRQAGVPIRAGVVEVLPGQRVDEARAELQSMGVTRITMDRARAVGRARLPGQSPTLDEMCGRCTRGRAAVLPNGDLAGCVLARDFPVGNVRETRLGELLGGEAWADLAARIPLPVRNGCPPDDSSDCNPASTTACGPKY
ncbi:MULTISPECIES: SPASM domain-containing protein [unclassified Streptomyces]|uniref:SPASM domain-containing protein n=1 Tax=unclassified Streptomyces TaxID=2593676 RepID=UPI00081AF2FC|nr:hypothetical protein GA0115234_1104145 [Streptomyces sp. DvalAA-43]